jgi:peptidoglycan hydrolase-like protein with peptidoglycan-binding domain
MRGLDSVTASDIPKEGTDVVMGYNGPSFRWSDADWAEFSGLPEIHTALAVHIDGDELDIETGAVDPADNAGIVGWVQRNPRPKVSLYMNGSTWPRIKGYIDVAGLTGKVVYRVAAWNGRPSQAPGPDAWAVQYSAPGFGAPGHYDENEVYDLSWFDAGFVAPTPPPSGPRILQQTMTGQDVIDLQMKLNGAGYALTPDGDFGPLTDQAVRSFQAAKGLTVDGQVGPQTVAALEAAQGETPTTSAQPVPIPGGTDRGAIVGVALSQLGQFTGHGFNNPNRYSSELGRPTEAWCGDFVSWVFKQKGVPLPSMQPGIATGFAFCPSAVNFGQQHGVVRPSWDAEPGDIFLFDWNGDGVSDHTEIMTGKEGDTVITVGGNSGPAGGVNQHRWNAPRGVGNNAVLVTLDVSKLVTLGGAPVPTPAPEAPVAVPPGPGAPAWPGRVLILKSPHLCGGDVRQVQQRLIDRGWTVPGGADGDYGPGSAEVITQFQREKGLIVDGQTGPRTWSELFRTDNVTP